MPNCSEFPQDITDEEQQKGFRLDEIDNPYKYLMSKPQTCKAVVKRISGTEYFVKVKDLNGTIKYSHQQCREGKWKPIEPLLSLDQVP